MLANSPLEAWIVILIAGACAGHAAIWIYHHNWWYAYPFRQEWQGKVVHAVHGFMILALPGYLAFRWCGDPAFNPFDFGTTGGAALASYLALCCVVGFVVVPAVTVGRWRRSRPAFQRSNHTEIRDIAREMGYRPIGTAKAMRLASLPFNEIFQVDFSEKTLQIADLPREWDGLSVLHLSDLHFIGTPDRKFHLRVMEACADWSPDLVAVTGDIVDSEQHRRWILPVLGRLRWNIAAFAILGNHDVHFGPELVRRRLRRLGMHVLGNGWKSIDVRGVPMTVIGHEGPWFGPGPGLGGCPGGSFRLCLSHTPDNIAWAKRNQVRLMLSGHNHGGQIRLPLFGSVFVPSRYSRKYDCGTFDESPTLLHVSRGLGQELPVRYNCRPEVVKLVLRCGE